MYKLLIYLAINFGALLLGSALMGNISTNTWYAGLQKAPWTPPGWVFGAAWFTVMLTFSIFMYRLTAAADAETLKKIYLIFAVQFVLNVLWNPIFFRWHFPVAGLIVIAALAIIVWYMFAMGKSISGWNTLWILPYGIWMIIATSLNAYVVVKN